ncbi:hypothetical protein CMQ_690 [Grosmannia clavigera kw1407]|uniref:Uncharacterized protein n=1 Tax=Grosmannia clavigera (strain kw1407 / UAMH 11150) TaxID=655863 RepID=F0XD00_GROCL|nr:uncharacterized protein CMQ_690 [Grosmannia clavigera kw1407]EFX03762.1 hypothetical protein CMQ_690 [Grosmannia clavigera kw1407]
MGATLSMIKTLFIPALIALLAYIIITFAVIPLIRFYHNRYSHYLPLDTITTQTSSIRQRMQSVAGRFLVPSTWQQRLRDRAAAGGGLGFAGGLMAGGFLGRQTMDDDTEFLSDGEDFDHDINGGSEGLVLGEEGEELGEIRRGEALLRGLPSQGAYNTNRLSRDLEQGFMDDSDDDEPPARRR